LRPEIRWELAHRARRIGSAAPVLTAWDARAEHLGLWLRCSDSTNTFFFFLLCLVSYPLHRTHDLPSSRKRTTPGPKSHRVTQHIRCIYSAAPLTLACEEYTSNNIGPRPGWQLSVARTSPWLVSAAAAAARTWWRRSLARRLATRLAADVRCARPTARGVACAALRTALRALLRCFE